MPSKHLSGPVEKKNRNHQKRPRPRFSSVSEVSFSDLSPLDLSSVLGRTLELRLSPGIPLDVATPTVRLARAPPSSIDTSPSPTRLGLESDWGRAARGGLKG